MSQGVAGRAEEKQGGDDRRSWWQRKGRLLLAKMLLALGSVVFTLLVLEIATRLLVDPPSPVLLREGIYVSQLAKVNGRDTVLAVEGEPLPEAKRKGEIRIFVFGESSIQGEPWGYYASPPTQLHDQLKAALPGKDITVVNMGRGAGYMIDSYYFLLSIARFSPDYVVVYQGGNDTYRVDREMCMPASHPTIYRAIRAVMERSRFFWTLRALGPRAIVKLHPPSENAQSDSPRGSEDLCDDTAAFRGWSEIMIETAQGMGAKVVMTTPVQNPLRWAEDGVALTGIDVPMHPADKEEPYRRLLACILDEGCDLAARWAEVQPAGRRGEGYRGDFWNVPRPQAMLEAARAHGAVGIDFGAYLKAHAHGGLSPLLFADEVHLTMEGYSQLAWLWTRSIAPELGASALPELPPPVDREPYLRDIFSHGGNGGRGGSGKAGRACLLIHWANLYLRVDMALIAGNLLKEAIALDRPAPGQLPTTRAGLRAALLLGWLRQLDGLDPQLPPALAAHMSEVSIPVMTKELREHNDCSSLGGPDPLPGEDLRGRQGPITEYAIPPGQEALFMSMLSGKDLAGCSLKGAQIDSTLVRATYACAGDTPAVVELHHPTEAKSPLATTAKMALTAGDPAPPAVLITALTAQIRDKEGAFTWLSVTKNENPLLEHKAPPPVPGKGRWVIGLGVLGLLALIAMMWRRRRA